MRRFEISFCLILLTRGFLLPAQDFSSLADSSIKIKSVLSKFSENTPQFTAVFHFQVLDTQGAPKLQMMMDIMMAKNKMREDVLVMAMSQMPADQRASMKSLQMDRIVFITHLDTKKYYLSFPGIAAYQEFSIKDETLTEIAARSQSVSLRKTIVGEETVNGHPCSKMLVELTETDRTSEKAIVWYAIDLKSFPVRIMFRKDNLIHVFEFKNVQLVNPSPTLFEIPPNYRLVENTAEVFRIAREKQPIQAPRSP